MAKLEWDATGERFYETGTDRCVLYLEKKTESKTDPYGLGVVWNGVTGITESPGGAEVSDLYADNIKYASLRSAETFGATIEAYTYPDEFMQCDGSVEPVVGVTLGQQSRSTFGLSYRTNIGNDTATESDDGYKILLIYGATASPSQKGYRTINNSPEAITFSWEVTTTPINVDGFKPVSTIVVNTLKANAEKVAALEKILYGDATNDARLPLPDEIIELFTPTDNSEEPANLSSY